MKKLMVFSALFVFTTVTAFTQAANGIYICAWGRGAFVPVWMETAAQKFGEAVDGDEVIFKNGTGVTWDPGSQPRVDFRVMGFSDNLGFVIHVNSEFLSGTGNGDNGAQIWVKPFGNDMLRMVVANHFMDDTLRGRVSTDTGFENFVLGQSMMNFSEGREVLNQDVIFNRFAGGRGSMSAANAANTSTPITPGAVLSNVFFLSSRPVEGLFIGLMLQGIFPETELEKTWRFMQLGIGYEIPNIGFARAQYIGGFMGKEYNIDDMYELTAPAKVEAAFALSAIPNLTLDMGVKLWMPVERHNDNMLPTRRSYRGVDAAIGAAYEFGDINVSFMAQALHIGAYDINIDNERRNEGMHLVFNLIPSYNFDFGTVGLSLIGQTKLANTDFEGDTLEATAWTRFGVGCWYSKGLANGSIKLGVGYAPPPIRTNPLDTKESGFHGRGIITVPIIFEYAFF
jgi:hypothetical protein